MKDKDKTQNHKPEELEKTESLEEIKNKADEYLAGWQRARADYENLLKEIAREKIKVINFANEDLLLGILPIIDNFEYALKHKPDTDKMTGEEKEQISHWITGVENIYKQFLDILSSYNLKKIEMGKDFDARIMEAIENRDVDGKKDNEVIEVVVSGYELNDKVIRPAKVIVNKKKE